MKNKFTLLELIIVIAIIGILVSLLQPRYGGEPERLENQSLTYMAEEVYLDLRDNYLNGNDDSYTA